MCLISVLSKGTLKIGDKVERFIKRGASCNTHGSGFAYKRNGEKEITLSKAYFNVDVLIKDINDANLTVDDELIIHHRISTGGNDKDLNTHPFVITPKFKDITVINAVVKKPVMAHNGIFWQYSEKIDKTFNDTVHWIHIWMNNPYILNMVKDDPEGFKNTYGDISNFGHSKLAFIFPDKGIVMVGDFEEDEGYFHSNSGYKEYVHDRGGSSCQRQIGFRQWDYPNDEDEEDSSKTRVKNKAFVINNFKSTDNDSFIKTEECQDKFGILKKELNLVGGPKSILYSSEKFLKLTKYTAKCYTFKINSGSSADAYIIEQDDDINNLTANLTNLFHSEKQIIVSTEHLAKNWQIRKVLPKYERIFNDIYLLKKKFGDDISNKKKKKLIAWYNTSFQKNRPQVKIDGKSNEALLVNTAALGLYLDNIVTLSKVTQPKLELAN